MSAGTYAVEPGLFSLDEQPGLATDCEARWPEPLAGDHLDDPYAYWLSDSAGTDAVELAEWRWMTETTTPRQRRYMR